MKNSTKRCLSLLLAASMLAACTGCGAAPTTDDTPDAVDGADTTAQDGAAGGTDGVKIGFVVKSLSDSFYVLMKAGAEAEAAKQGVELAFIAPNSESDVQGQVDMIQNLLGQEIDALCVSPSSPDAVLPVFEQATAQGVPVLAVDNGTTYENKITFIGTGSRAAGKIGGEYAASVVGAGANAVILRGRLGDSNHDEREAGFREGLEAGGVNVLEVKACDSESEKSMNTMQDIMNRFDNIDIVCTTADSMAQGAQRAIENAGVDIPVLGFDGTIPVAEMTAEGKFLGTVAQDPYNMGVVGVQMAIKAALGQTIDERIDTGANMVTQDNAADFVANLKQLMGE